MSNTRFDEPSLELIRRLHPISEMSAEGWRSVLPLCEFVTYAQGKDPLSERGWAAHNVYLVSGELRIDSVKGSSTYWLVEMAARCGPSYRRRISRFEPRR